MFLSLFAPPWCYLPHLPLPVPTGLEPGPELGILGLVGLPWDLAPTEDAFLVAIMVFPFCPAGAVRGWFLVQPP